MRTSAPVEEMGAKIVMNIVNPHEELQDD